MRVVVAVLVALIAAATDAAADVELSGSVGAQMVGTEPRSIAAAELDLETETLSLGLGVAVRFAGSELVEDDWDQWRDGARALRYLLYQPRLGSVAAASLAAGQLDAITVGNGSAVDGVAAGVDIDRQRLGVDLQIASAGGRAHAWLDDLVDPEIGALRVAGTSGALEVGATFAGDRGAAGGPDGSVGLDVALSTSRGALGGAAYSDLVHAVGGGVGVHLGVRGNISDVGHGGDAASRIGLRLEGHAASAGYLPGWIGPLYIRDRLIANDAGGGAGGGLGGLVEISATRERAGTVSARLEHRAGRGPGGRAELRAPYWAAMQAGAWAALERDAAAFGAEVRVRFPRSLFARLEARRQYATGNDSAGDAPMLPPAIWTVGATFGASLGE